MKRLWIVLAFVSLGGCDRSGPALSAYRYPADALARAVPLVQLFGIYPCANTEKWNGVTVIVGVPTDQCYKMKPAQRYRGVWLDEFEGSAFYENATDAKTVMTAYKRDFASAKPSDETLGWNSGVNAKLPANDKGYSRMVALDFIGRRTAYTGHYGHMGMSKSEIIVDRVFSARVIYQSRTGYLATELGLH